MIYEASSELNNAMVAATSSGVPYRPLGTMEQYDSRIADECISLVNGVSTGLGATALTVMSEVSGHSRFNGCHLEVPQEK